jgi:hypothetical protein
MVFSADHVEFYWLDRSSVDVDDVHIPAEYAVVYTNAVLHILCSALY